MELGTVLNLEVGALRKGLSLMTDLLCKKLYAILENYKQKHLAEELETQKNEQL
jgi:hypothetical protein